MQSGVIKQHLFLCSGVVLCGQNGLSKMESFSGLYAVLVLVTKAVVELKGIVISSSEHEPLFKFGYSRSIVAGRATERTLLKCSHDGRVFQSCQSFSLYEPMILAAWMCAFVSSSGWK